MFGHSPGPSESITVDGPVISWLMPQSPRGQGHFSVTIEQEADWQAVGDDPLTWSDGRTVAELSVSCGSDSLMIVVSMTNTSSEPVVAHPPSLRFSGPGRMVWWLGGEVNYVAHLLACQVNALSPIGGNYLADEIQDGLLVRPRDRVVLEPGGEYLMMWRTASSSTPEDLRSEFTPSWYPDSAVVEQAETISLHLPDGIVQAPTLSVVTEFPDQVLHGPVGIHQVRVIGSRGSCSLELGWAQPLGVLVDAALETPAGLPADLLAWFLAWRLNSQQPSTDADLDLLDIVLAEAIAHPTPFAVAAAADATAVLGPGTLTDAATALTVLLDTAERPDGIHLAAFRLYAQASAAGVPVAKAVLDALGSRGGPTSMEAELLSSPADALRHADFLAAALGFGCPGHVPGDHARDAALLKYALSWDIRSERLFSLTRVQIEAERWLRASRLKADQLAWLLW